MNNFHISAIIKYYGTNTKRMEITFQIVVENQFNSVEEIREKINGHQKKFPNLTDWESLEKEIGYWKNCKSSINEIINLVKTLFSENSNIEGNNNSAHLIIKQNVCFRGSRYTRKKNPRPFKKTRCNNWKRLYANDIRPFLVPLIKHTFMDEQKIELIQEIWTILLEHPFAREEIYLLMTRNSHEWMYSNEYDKCQIPSLIPYLQKWDKLFPHYNFNIIFDLLNLFIRCGTNYFPALVSLHQEQKQNFRSLQFIEIELDNLIKQLNFAISYQAQLYSGEKTLQDLINQVVPGDFGILNCELSKRCMEQLKKAIDGTFGAEQWFQYDGSPYSNDPIAKILKNHREVNKCGHSGSSIGWTFSQFKDIYQNGWSKWVLRIFLGMGIGWEQVDFNTAYELKNELCLVYKIQIMDLTYEQFIKLLASALEQEQEELVSALFAKSIMIPLDLLAKLTYYCDDKNKNAVKYLLHRKWDELYPRRLDLSIIDFTAFLIFLWSYLPNIPVNSYDYDDSNAENDNICPTREQVKIERTKYESINRLNNRDFHFIQPISNFNPYHFDREMNEIGFMARVLNEFNRQMHIY